MILALGISLHTQSYIVDKSKCDNIYWESTCIPWGDWDYPWYDRYWDLMPMQWETINEDWEQQI